MTYNELTAALQNYIQAADVGQTPPISFSSALPVMVGNAELRIYRELDFLATRGSNTSLSFTSGNRQLLLSSLTGETVGSYPVTYAYPVVVQRISALVSGAWVDFIPTALDFIDAAWPAEATTGIPGAPNVPTYAAQIDHVTAVVCPTPAASYPARVTGTWRPAPMSVTQQQSWLGDTLPDLLFASAMVEAEGYIQNFGAQSDDPKEAQSWESQYQMHKNSALEEEQRRKGQGQGWQPYSPAPIAGSPRN